MCEFLFIDDLTEIVWQLLFQRDNNVVNVVSGQSHDFMTIVNSINLLADYSVHVNSRARVSRRLIRHIRTNCSRLYPEENLPNNRGYS